jgi:hypothetical protein
MEIKGIVRYVTPDQKLYYDLAYIGFFAGAVLVAGAMALHRKFSN